MADSSANDRAEKAARAKDRVSFVINSYDRISGFLYRTLIISLFGGSSTEAYFDKYPSNLLKQKLKKFQAKKKAGESTSTPTEVNSNSELDHPYSSSLTEPITNSKNEISQDEHDESNSIPVVQLRSPMVVSPDAKGTQQPAVESAGPVSKLSESQQQTIALLVGEKNILINQLEDSSQEVSKLSQALHETEKQSTDQIANLSKDFQDTRTKLVQVQAELEEITNSRDTLISELEHTKARVEELGQSNENSKDEIIQEFESKLRMKQNHSDAIESELSRTKNQLKSQDDRQQEQHQMIECLKQENLSFQERLTESHTQARSTTATLDTLQQNHQQLLTKNSAKESQLKDISEKFDVLKSHSDSLTAQLTEFKTSHDSLSSTTTQLERKLSESDTQKSALREENQNLLRNLEELKLKIVQLTDQKVQSSNRIEEILKIVREREGELSTTREELSNQRRTHEKEKEQYELNRKLIEQQLEQAQHELSQVKNASDEERVSLQQQLASCTDQLQHQQLESQGLCQQLQELNSLLEQSRQQIDVAMNNQTQTGVQLAEKIASLDAAVAREQQLKLQLESLSCTLTHERGQNEELEKLAQNSRDTISQLQKEIESLQGSCKAAMLRGEEHETRHAAQVTRIKTLESANQDTSDQLVRMTTESTSLQEKIQENHAHISEIQGQLDLKVSESGKLLQSLNHERNRVTEVEALLEESRSSVKNLTLQLESAHTSYEALVMDHTKKFQDEEQSFNEASERWSQKVNQLQDQYQESQTRLTKTEDFRVKLAETISSLESKLSSSEIAVQTLEASLESGKIDQEENKIESDKKQKELDELIKSLRSENSGHEVLIQGLQETVADLNSRLEISGQKLNSSLEEYQRVQNDLQESKSDLSQQKQNLASALHDLVTVKNTLQDMEDQLSAAKLEHEELLMSKDAAEVESKNYREKMSMTSNNLQAELLSCRKRIDLQEEQISQSAQKSSELKEEINALEQEKSVLIKEMEEGQEGENRILEKSRSEILALKQKIHQLKEEGELMKQDLSQTKVEFEQNDQVKEDEIHRLNNELKELKRLETESSKSRDKAFEEKNDGIKKNSVLHNALESLRQDKTDLENKLEEHQRESRKRVDELSVQITDLATQLEERRQEQQLASSQAQTKHETLLSRTKELEDIQGILKSCKIEHQKVVDIAAQRTLLLQEELDATKLANEQMKVETGPVHKEIQRSELEKTRQFSEELARKDAEISRVKSLLTSKSQEYESSEMELGELKNRHANVEKELQTSSKIHSSIATQLQVESDNLKAQLASQANLKVDQDYVDSILQQHQIDLSTARSQIRALETRIFEEESRSHEMLTRVENLQDQLRGAEEALKEAKNSSANPIQNFPTRTTKLSNRQSVPMLLDQSSPNSSRANPQTSFSKMIDESDLSERTKSYRKESLMILKTRMESELGLSALSLSERNSISDDVQFSPGEEDSHVNTHHNTKDDQNHFETHHKFIARSKLGDDMVWCGDCVGDLFMI